MKTKILAALRAAETFISDELETRNSSFLPGADEDQEGYIGSATMALKKVQGAIGVMTGPDETLDALKLFVDRMERYGNWDEGCFYYSRMSAPELQKPIADGKAAIVKSEGK